jgi:hypothetical protein
MAYCNFLVWKVGWHGCTSQAWHGSLLCVSFGDMVDSVRGHLLQLTLSPTVRLMKRGCDGVWHRCTSQGVPCQARQPESPHRAGNTKIDLPVSATRAPVTGPSAPAGHGSSKQTSAVRFRVFPGDESRALSCQPAEVVLGPLNNCLCWQSRLVCVEKSGNSAQLGRLCHCFSEILIVIPIRFAFCARTDGRNTPHSESGATQSAETC